MTQVREQTESGSSPGCVTQRPRASSPKRGEGRLGTSTLGTDLGGEEEGRGQKQGKGQERDPWGQECAGLTPHPSFWSGFSCRPESRRMRQSSYLSRVPEAPAAR